MSLQVVFLIKAMTTRLGYLLQPGMGHCADRRGWGRVGGVRPGGALLLISKHNGRLFCTAKYRHADTNVLQPVSVSVTPAICNQHGSLMEVPPATGNICYRATVAFMLHKKKSEIYISDPLPNEVTAAVMLLAWIGIPKDICLYQLFVLRLHS